MLRLPAFVVSCSILLPLAGAEYAGQSQKYDEDEVGLLQSVVNKHTADAGPCPSECIAPQCRSGVPGFDGWKSLDDDRCFYYCMQFPTGRFCGEGTNFQGENSVDCKNCRPRPSTKPPTPPPKEATAFADFAIVDKELGKIDGQFYIDVVRQREEKNGVSSLVEWEVKGLQIDPAFIQKGCGKLLKGEPTFNYHLHEFWNFPKGQTSSVFDCSLENVGNHWDPTAACGPASGNEVCDEKFCNTRGMNYTCDPKLFNPYSRAQYRLLSPSELFPKDVTCEFGDFSGMTGPIEAEVDPKTKGVVQTREHDGKAAMSATFGEIKPETLKGRPHLSCQFDTLPKQGEKRLTFEQATLKTPLDAFPKDASVLVHCGNNYENSNARFFCALLQDKKP